MCERGALGGCVALLAVCGSEWQQHGPWTVITAGATQTHTHTHTHTPLLSRPKVANCEFLTDVSMLQPARQGHSISTNTHTAS